MYSWNCSSQRYLFGGNDEIFYKLHSFIKERRKKIGYFIKFVGKFPSFLDVNYHMFNQITKDDEFIREY